jgi:hypothetical protein
MSPLSVYRNEPLISFAHKTLMLQNLSCETRTSLLGSLRKPSVQTSNDLVRTALSSISRITVSPSRVEHACNSRWDSCEPTNCCFELLSSLRKNKYRSTLRGGFGQTRQGRLRVIPQRSDQLNRAPDRSCLPLTKSCPHLLGCPLNERA